MIKHSLKGTLLSIALLCSLLSCNKDDNNNSGNNNNNNNSAFFAAKVNGTDFPEAAEKHTKVKFVKSTKTLQLIGQPDDQKETIIVTLVSFSTTRTTVADWTPGTYTSDITQSQEGKYSIGGNYNKWNGNGYDEWGTYQDHPGQKTELVIESNDGTNIKGTFKFDAVYSQNGVKDPNNVKQIREGTFNVKINEI